MPFLSCTKPEMAPPNSIIIMPPSSEATLIERWRIGSTQDTVIFAGKSGATHVAIESEGDLLLADRAASIIYRINAVGEVVNTFGSRGEGPGEFERISGLNLIEPDTIVVKDGFLGRLSYFTPRGKHLKSGLLAARPTVSARRDCLHRFSTCSCRIHQKSYAGRWARLDHIGAQVD